jgi:hypothetical protein
VPILPGFQSTRAISLVLLIALALILTVNSGGTAAMWLTLLLRPLMHGVSLFKINFLLVFLIICGATIFMKLKPASIQTTTLLKRVALGSILGGAIASMASFLDTSYRLDLPLSKYVYFFSHGLNSIDYFSHIHTSKAGLYYLVKALGLERLSQSADTGKAIVEYVNPYLAISVLIAAVLTLIMLVMLSKVVLSRWSGWRQGIALILYGISGSHVVKCLFDGGPLAYDFLPSLISLFLLIGYANNAEVPWLLKRTWFRIVLLFALFLAFVALISPGSAVLVQPLQYAYFTSLLLVLWLALLYQLKRNWNFVALAVCSTALCGYYFYINCAPDIRILNTRVTKDERVLKYEASVNESHGEFPTLAIVDTTEQMSGKKLFQVYRECGENPLRNRNLVVKPANRSAYTGFLFALRILKSSKELTLESDRQIKFTGLSQPAIGHDSVFVFRVIFDTDSFPSLWQEAPTIKDQNNEFAVLYYLNRYFAARGLEDYVLIPMYYEEVS